MSILSERSESKDWQIADVAQLVEQDFRKVKVGGSIPLIGLFSYG